MDVYDRPASIFVAGFIGSPAMNFLAATVGEEPRGELPGATAARRHPRPGAAGLGASGAAVTLGIRPEHLLPADDGPLVFEVELAEPLGADTLLHGRFGPARPRDGATGRPRHRQARREAPLHDQCDATASFRRADRPTDRDA